MNTALQEPLSFNSTYGIRVDRSYRSEKFKYVPLTWKLGVCRIEALKIRIATWKPKQDRSYQSVFYFDVETESEANKILADFKSFNFKKLEGMFDQMFNDDNVRLMNTGDTINWLLKAIPMLRLEFASPI